MPNKKKKRTAKQQANLDANRKKRQKRRERALRKGTHPSQEDPMDRLMRRIAEKEKRQDVAVRISDSVEASLIQTIGKCVVLYKPNPTPNPKLSNLLRYSF